MMLTKSHALYAAPNVSGSLEHSDIGEALLEKCSSCGQASQASSDHHHTRLSPSPQAATERVIRAVATGFTTLHTVRAHLLGACDDRERVEVSLPDPRNSHSTAATPRQDLIRKRHLPKMQKGRQEGAKREDSQAGRHGLGPTNRQKVDPHQPHPQIS